MNDEMPPLQVMNCVSTFSLGKTLDLDFITRNIPVFSYDNSRFAAAIAHLSKPQSTILLFGSGAGVSAGCRSLMQARIAVFKLFKLLKRCGIKGIRAKAVTVQNLVCSSAVPFSVDLREFRNSMPSNAIFQPSLFPGIRLHLKVDGCEAAKNSAVLLYNSGACVVTGCTTYAAAYAVWSATYNAMLAHRNNTKEKTNVSVLNCAKDRTSDLCVAHNKIEASMNTNTHDATEALILSPEETSSSSEKSSPANEEDDEDEEDESESPLIADDELQRRATAWVFSSQTNIKKQLYQKIVSSNFA